jgi:MoaA/NifB/PqqE/SkfB family radical SAM enzyme
MRLLRKKNKVHLLYLEVTHRCNLKCVACYTGAGLEKPDSLTLDEQKSVVNQANRMGAKVVSLSGSGEPLLYKHLFALIDHISQLGMVTVVFTNGTTLNRETADFLISRKVVVYFKLYSLNPTVFDRMVGKKGAYKWADYSYRYNGISKTSKIPSGLKNLLEARKAEEDQDLVRIETLITRINYSTLPQVAQLSKELNLGFHLETPVFKARAIENYDDIALNADEYRGLYHKLADILGKEYFENYCNHPCPVERNPVVWTNGEVGFCSSRRARIGNVRDVPLDKLFLKAKKLKYKEDRLIAKRKKSSRYFRTCPARQYFEIEHGIPCNY